MRVLIPVRHELFLTNKEKYLPFSLIKKKFLEVLQTTLEQNQAKNKSLLSRYYITHGLSPGKAPQSHLFFDFDDNVA
jgi:hypothetical protein